MAVTITPYGFLLESLFEGRVNCSADKVFCMLVNSSYVFNQNQKFKSAISGEISGSGYVSGGIQVTVTPVPWYNPSTKRLTIPAGNLVWPSVTWTGAVGAVVYMNPAGFPDDAKPLISYVNFGESVDRSAEAFYINWPASGIVNMAVP